MISMLDVSFTHQPIREVYLTVSQVDRSFITKINMLLCGDVDAAVVTVLSR